MGKTTTAINAAAFLTHQGYRVLLIDMDSQASASLAVGISWDHISPSLADVIQNNFPIRSAIHKTYLSGLDVIPGDTMTLLCVTAPHLFLYYLSTHWYVLIIILSL